MRDKPVPVGARELMYRAAELEAERQAALWLNARARGPVPRARDESLTAAVHELMKAERKLREARKREACAA